MEWTKYVLALSMGAGLMIMFGRKGQKRNKWLLGAGAGIGLTAMEMVVQYIWNREIWEMAISVLRGTAFFSLLVLLGYGKEWLEARGRSLISIFLVRIMEQMASAMPIMMPGITPAINMRPTEAPEMLP